MKFRIFSDTATSKLWIPPTGKKFSMWFDKSFKRFSDLFVPNRLPFHNPNPNICTNWGVLSGNSFEHWFGADVRSSSKSTNLVQNRKSSKCCRWYSDVLKFRQLFWIRVLGLKFQQVIKSDLLIWVSGFRMSPHQLSVAHSNSSKTIFYRSYMLYVTIYTCRTRFQFQVIFFSI